MVTRTLPRFRTGLIAAAAILTAAVAGLAFWVSFEAISTYVVRIGALPYNLRYAGPLLVDSFTVLATVFLLWLALAGRPLRRIWDAYYAWSVIVVATAASAYLNAAHVHPDAPTAAFWVAGAVPVTLLASVHLLVLLLLRLLARPDWNIPPPPKPEPSQPEPEPVPAVRPPSTQDTARRERPVGGGRPTPGQQVKIRDLVSQDPKLKARGIWREHFPGMTESWYRTKLIPFVAEVKGELVPISRNGDRP